MSSASLAFAPRAHPDRARIAAISAAMALNIAVIVIASRPITPEQLAVVHQLTPAALIRLIEPPPIVKPPPPIHLKPLPVLATPTHVALPHTHVTTPVVEPTTAQHLPMPPVTIPSLLPTTGNISGDAQVDTPIEATLAYRAAPLHYPGFAVRQHMHGTVLLRVLVDATGKPIQVIVDQGSGFVLLDRSAREQVLAHWRFQPAMVNGQAVRAWATVPVTFDLRG